MNKVNLLLTEANGNLSDCKEMITDAVVAAYEYVFPRLKVDWDIDLLVTNRLCNIIFYDYKDLINKLRLQLNLLHRICLLIQILKVF